MRTTGCQPGLPFLGLEGDIAALGANRANHWYYDSWDTNDAIWSTAEDDPVPMMFVSFPALKDPAAIDPRVLQHLR